MDLHRHHEMWKFIWVVIQGSSEEDGLGLRDMNNNGFLTSSNLGAALVIGFLHKCMKVVVDSALEGFNPLLSEKTIVGGVAKVFAVCSPAIH